MDFTFNQSKEFQITAWLWFARSLEKGFFQQLRSVVLPHLNTNAWYFPDYGILSDLEFKKRLNALTFDKFWIDDKYLLNTISEKYDLIPKALTFKEQQELNEIKKKFDEILDPLFGHIDMIEQCEVMRSVCGTFASFFPVKHENGKYKFYLWYREDKDISHLFRVYLGCILQMLHIFDELDYDQWNYRQFIMDFMLNNTKLNDLFNNEQITGTLEYLSEYKGELIEQSREYFEKLNLPITSCFSYENNNIIYNNKILANLTSGELNILKTLIDHKSTVVSFDRIGEAYWEDKTNDKYSLQALAKVIERIRKKLKENGILADYIFTVRKQGYILYD